MGQATSLVLREQIYALQRQGNGPKAISEQLSIPYGTVKHLCRKFKSFDKECLAPKYANCGRKPFSDLEASKKRALELRQQHPKWGAPRIRVELQVERSAVSGEEALSGIRALQRFFRKKEAYPPRRQSAEPSIGRSLAPHNIWEVDAKERFTLQDGSPACYLTITDEKTGAWLEAPVFPLCTYQSSPHQINSTGLNQHI
jgi:transposase